MSPSSPIRRAPRSFLLVGVLLAVACSKQPAAPDSPATMDTLDQASAAFDGAEDDLSATLGRTLGRDETFDPAPGPEATQYQNQPSPSPPAQPNPSPRPAAAEQSACSRACKALASMQRAAERVCELTGDDDERCEDVRDRVASARRRVARSCKRCTS